MTQNNGHQRTLPPRELSYEYTVAMNFGQQLELNLRAILYTADYHGWGRELKLTERQLKQFKDTSVLIDRATCGLIIEKLHSIGIIKSKEAMRSFEKACEHRNKLAHNFLSNLNFDTMTKTQEKEAISELHTMVLDLYPALQISRIFREKSEHEADKSHKSMQEFFASVDGSTYDNPNRKYGTRLPKPKKK